MPRHDYQFPPEWRRKE